MESRGIWLFYYFNSQRGFCLSLCSNQITFLSNGPNVEMLSPCLSYQRKNWKIWNYGIRRIRIQQLRNYFKKIGTRLLKYSEELLLRPLN